MKKIKKRKYSKRPTTKEKIAITVDAGTKDKIKELDDNLSRFVNEGIKKMLIALAGK